MATRLRKGQLVVLESTTYPGTTDEELLPAFEASRPALRPRLLPGLLAGARGPGQPDLPHQEHPQGRRRGEPGLAPSWRRRSTRRRSTRSVPVSSARGGGVDQAAREHLPLGQHRPGQRAEDDLRPHGHRRVGGHRGRQDQALRLHAVLSRARAWAGHCIPLDPFYLSWKAAEYGIWTRFIELAGEVNTAMPRLRCRPHREGPQRAPQEPQGGAGARARPLLQGEHRRRPRVAVLRDHRAAARAGGGGRLLRSVLPGGPSRPRPRPRPLVGALHDRGVRPARRPGGVDGPLGVPRPGALRGTSGSSSTPAT